MKADFREIKKSDFSSDNIKNKVQQQKELQFQQFHYLTPDKFCQISLLRAVQVTNAMRPFGSENL